MPWRPSPLVTTRDDVLITFFKCQKLCAQKSLVQTHLIRFDSYTKRISFFKVIIRSVQFHFLLPCQCKLIILLLKLCTHCQHTTMVILDTIMIPYNSLYLWAHRWNLRMATVKYLPLNCMSYNHVTYIYVVIHYSWDDGISSQPAKCGIYSWLSVSCESDYTWPKTRISLCNCKLCHEMSLNNQQISFPISNELLITWTFIPPPKAFLDNFHCIIMDTLTIITVLIRHNVFDVILLHVVSPWYYLYLVYTIVAMHNDK